MKYKFNCFDNKEVLATILNMFTEEELSEPIKNNPKGFEKRIKGFRPNKIPMKKLVNIYYDDFLFKDSILNEFLERKIAERFDAIGISNAIIENKTNEIDLFFSIKEILLKCKLEFNVNLILDMAGIEYNKATLCSIDMGSRKLIDFMNANLNAMHDMEQKNLTDKNERLGKNIIELKKEKDKLRETNKAEKEKLKIQAKTITELGSRINSLEESLEQLRETKAKLDERYSDLDTRYGAKEAETRKLKDDISELKHQLQTKNEEIDKFNESIQELKEKQFSSSLLFETVESLIDSLKDSNENEGELINYIKTNFSEETTLINALESLQKNELKIMQEICKKMDDNLIDENDLNDLRSLENEICVEFLICKSIKSLCTRYLEQMHRKETVYDVLNNRI